MAVQSSSEDLSTKKLYKLAVLGCGGVGKSTLVNRFMRDEWEKHEDPTILSDIRREAVIDGEQCILDIWDTAADYFEFECNLDSVMRERDGIILMYSITSFNTFEKLDGYLERLWMIKDGKWDETGVVLAGNKCDLQAYRQVRDEQGLEKTQRWNEKGMHIRFYETSGKEGINCEEVFFEVTRLIHLRTSSLSSHSLSNDEGGCCVLL